MSVDTPDDESTRASDSRSRRRGAELDDAIVQAAWGELVEVGFDGLTYEGIAKRAATTRSVIYRRWPTLLELARTAILRQREFSSPHVPDTGSLRGDIIESLAANSMADARIALASYLLAGHFRTSSGEVADPLGTAVRPKDAIIAPEIYLRAQRRGEVNLTGVPDRVLDLPTTLLIGQMLETLRSPSRDEIAAMVDEVFLPVLRAYRALPQA